MVSNRGNEVRESERGRKEKSFNFRREEAKQAGIRALDNLEQNITTA